MSNQIIFSIGREFGSGGHEIAQKLSEKMGIQLVDRKLVEEICTIHGEDRKILEKYDEHERNLFLSRTIGDYNNSIADHIAKRQFDYMKNLAESGESFVIVGRCSDYILRANPNLVTVFITGEVPQKLGRVEQIYKLSEKEALNKMKRHDKTRSSYHDYYSDTKWGIASTYDIVLNSSRFGIDKCVDLLASAAE